MSPGYCATSVPSLMATACFCLLVLCMLHMHASRARFTCTPGELTAHRIGCLVSFQQLKQAEKRSAGISIESQDQERGKKTPQYYLYFLELHFYEMQAFPKKNWKDFKGTTCTMFACINHLNGQHMIRL